MEDNLYRKDFYTWALEQANLLKIGKMDAVDMDNLIEEVEEMGNNKERALDSQITRLLHHLLKWQYQPSHRGSSWESTIINSRVEIRKLLNKNPGLKNILNEVYIDAWEYAVEKASGETKLSDDVFPKQNPWTFEEIMDKAFWPEGEEDV